MRKRTDEPSSTPKIPRRELLRLAVAAGSAGVAAPLIGQSPLLGFQKSGGGLLIRRGRLVTAEKQWNADIRVSEGKIAEIGPNLKAKLDERVIDASGLQVLPGGIDPHAHLLPPWVDDYLSGTQGAVAGGVTTVGCMVTSQRDETFMDALARETKRVQEQAVGDIFLHPILRSPTKELQEQIAQLPKNGHSDIKIFMTSPGFVNDQPRWTEVIRTAGSLGLITMLHCEDGQLMAEAAKALTAAGHTTVQYYSESRPVLSEVRASDRAVTICEQTGAPVYIVHLSSEAALEVCRKAKARGLPVYVETRPIYLYFTKERYLQPDGPLYVGQPPLRDASDVKALWDGLASGAIDTLGTDHAPYTREQKMDPELNITRLRPGVADLQTVDVVLYSEGVVKKRLSLERFVAVTSTNAAKLFGLYPKKGTIAVGSDADLAIWDPREKKKFEKSGILSRSGYSLHEGWELTGWPKITIRRGEVVFENGKVATSPGSGQIASAGPTQPLRGKGAAQGRQ